MDKQVIRKFIPYLLLYEFQQNKGERKEDDIV